MAEKRRFLDVWIVETNSVYKEVPFAVVSDWVQQGRLLEDDKIKPSGTKDWFRIGASPELTPYLPRPAPHRPTDEAEALEPVMLDFTYKRPADEEDDDVDMIPLIDVSLVLLIFFMLTATGAVISSPIPTPQARAALMADNPSGMRIDIALDSKNMPVYSLGVGANAPEKEDTDLPTQAALLDRLKARLARTDGPVDLVINADKSMKAKVPRDLLVALRGDGFRDKISAHYFGVTEGEP